ncbi:IS1182 family transposase [Candidatus Enterococcus clewellii]|uniref:Transposase n=4 Tax=Candidatus Enterococcus clewellii TaxID=1834193 RepID=A0AAQ3VVV5_9ENTE
MHTYYNMNQLTLDITTSYIPKKENTAWFINELVESLQISDPYFFGRPREYDLAAMLKLVLFAYTRSVFSSRKIEQLAEESLPARWLTQEQLPSYRTIARFRVSVEIENLLTKGLDSLVDYLRKCQLIDDAVFIDGTKILADANKYSFVWKKSTIKFDQMNRETILQMMAELKEAYRNKQIPDGSSLTLEMVDEVITRMELRLEELEEKVKETKKVSPNPAKQERRTLKSQKRKLIERRERMVEHQTRLSICGTRNSYSKTDHEATFMRVKEDPMRNGQLKPAYNLQIATCNQFVLGYDVYQNPTDTKTLIPLLERMNIAEQEKTYLVADAGYGSERNYRYLEDELSTHTALIPYGTMHKEKSRKWQTDERKIINWMYHAEEDYYIDSKGVRFNFNAYRKRPDKEGFVRDFKEYQAEKYDENKRVIPEALTRKGNRRKITVNPSWEYFKAKQRELLSTSETSKIYARRKIDVETVFGSMKACLGFTRYHVRGLANVRKESGIVVMALNMMKLAVREKNKGLKIKKRSEPKNYFTIFWFASF